MALILAAAAMARWAVPGDGRAATGKHLHTFDSHTGYISEVAFAGQGRRVWREDDCMARVGLTPK